MNMSFQLPFRILVIDDFHGKSSAKFQAAVSGYLYDLVKGNEHGKDCRVDVRFANTPEMGVSLWQKEIFDLTLVDSDFKDGKKKAMRDDAEKLSFLDLDVELVGGYLFRFLYEIMDRDQEQRDRNLSMRDGCSVVLWTGMHCRNEKERERAERLLDILGPKLRDGAFVPKCEEERENWENTFNDLVKKRLDMGCDGVSTSFVGTLKDSIESVLEKRAKIGRHSALARLVTCYKTKSAEEFQRIYAKWPVESAWVTMEPSKAGWTPRFALKKPKSDEQENGECSVPPLWISPKLRTAIKLRPILFPGDGLSGTSKEPGADKNQKNNVEDIAKSGCFDFVEPFLVEPDETEKNEFAAGRRFLWVPENASKTDLESPFCVAAASPLTGVSAVGKDRAIGLLKQKVHALLSGPFDQVVLKTVYMDELNAEKKDDWPRLQIQSRQKTRCYRSATHLDTLWNTGTTANEAMSPAMLNEFLLKFPQSDSNQSDSKKIIVSLGSKYPIADSSRCSATRRGRRGYDSPGFKSFYEIWKSLFGTVFNGVRPEAFPVVEINVRHYLRECLKRNFHTGDEYVNPGLGDENFSGNYEKVDEEFNSWLRAVVAVAKNNGKKLLLKLPYRSDLLHFIKLIRDASVTEDAKDVIRGVTLINAYKSALCVSNTPNFYNTYSPAWYGVPDFDKDSEKWDGCQMSGGMLAAARNQIVPKVLEKCKGWGWEIHVSGGIMRKEDVDVLKRYGAGAIGAVQLGTWPLLNLKLDGKIKDGACEVPGVKVKGCETCSDSGGYLDIQKWTGHEYRIAFCLHELCRGCGKCSRTFYCDTFLDRRGVDLPPIMDSRNCTGCGLCAQVCPHGAIQLFEPEHFAVLIAEKEVLEESHSMLSACEVPHLVYDADYIRKLAAEVEMDVTAPRGEGAAGTVERIWASILKNDGKFLEKCPVIYCKNQGDIESLKEGVSKDTGEVPQKLRAIREEVNRRLNALRERT